MLLQNLSYVIYVIYVIYVLLKNFSYVILRDLRAFTWFWEKLKNVILRDLRDFTWHVWVKIPAPPQIINLPVYHLVSRQQSPRGIIIGRVSLA